MFFEKHVTLSKSNSKKVKFVDKKADIKLIQDIKKLDLISNGNIVPEGSVTSTIFCRLIFDRDILSKDHWVRRG